MSVMIKGMKKPKKCEWMDEEHEYHRCPLLNCYDDCNLQDCDSQWSWEDQMVGCPLVEIREGVDLVDRNYLLSEYDKQHKGAAGGARKIMKDAPTIFEEGEGCR